MKDIRIGLIGAGNWAQNAHVPAFLREEGVELVGVTDINPVHTRLVSDEFGIPGYPGLEEMLAGSGCNVLDVVTSRGMHFKPVMMGLERGLDILCEKPLGHSLDESRQLYHAARKPAGVTHMGFTFRYSPAIQFLRDLILQGYLGTVYALQGFEENAQLIDSNTPLPRIGFSPKTDSGALHGFGSHLLDLARWILGEFESVSGDMATYIKERPVLGEDARLPVEVDDSTIVIGRFHSGVQTVMQFSKIQMGYAPGLEMRIFGSRAALWVRLEESPDGFEHLCTADLSNRNFRPLPVPAGYLEDFHPDQGWPRAYFNRLVRHFIERVRTRDLREGQSDFLDGMKAQELLEAIERSNRERRWVKLSEIK